MNSEFVQGALVILTWLIAAFIAGAFYGMSKESRNWADAIIREEKPQWMQSALIMAESRKKLEDLGGEINDIRSQ